MLNNDILFIPHAPRDQNSAFHLIVSVNWLTITKLSTVHLLSKPKNLTAFHIQFEPQFALWIKAVMLEETTTNEQNTRCEKLFMGEV